ncbi:barstar family protein [Chryseobacterium sp. MYb264]|uniref:barstar family protein n=1 Tax=Chryseobacterium sp. MYb264 TaxID=2745153 RepID=UPI002E11E739|nr:barstar family protein [Chryseobacterium sp. MYb264]
MFAFSLDTAKDHEIITYIKDVKNLENNKRNIGFRKLQLIDVEDINKLVFEIEKATKIYNNQGSIHLLDKNKSIITQTFISNIKIIKSQHNNILLTGHVWHHPKGFHKSWQMFINDEIKQKNIWEKFHKDELQGWLVFALTFQKIQIDKENLVIQLDGNNFNNLDEFFCTLGEEVNGICGYFGRQLPALYDCLRGNFGVKSFEEITWLHHQRSKKMLKNNFNKILDIFKEFNIPVILK